MEGIETDYRVSSSSGFVDTSSNKSPHHKYYESLKKLFPIRFGKKKTTIFPVGKVGLFSFITSSWLTSFIWNTYKKGLDDKGINWHLDTEDSSTTNSNRLDRLWQEELKKNGPQKASMGKVMLKFIRTRMILNSVVLCIFVVISFIGPAIVVQQLLQNIESTDGNTWRGPVLVVILFISEFFRVSLQCFLWNHSTVTGLRLRGAVLSIVLKKVLKIYSSGDKSVGELINICNNDGQVLMEAVAASVFTLMAPVTAIITIVYCQQILNNWALLGCGIFILFYPFNVFIGSLTTYFREKGICVTDERVHMMSDVLNNIKLIKMYAWENPLANEIEVIRHKEAGYIEKCNLVQSFNTTITPLIYMLATTATLIASALSGENFSAAQAFTIASAFSATRFSLNILPYCVRLLFESRVSANRIKHVLVREEILIRPHSYHHDHALSISGCDFTWSSFEIEPSKPNKKNKTGLDHDGHTDGLSSMLKNINLQVSKGHVVGICGSVGTGKSSLISAIMGEMKLVTGTINIYGSIAFVPQQAWLFNGTVKDNILFGNDYNEERYNKVVHASGLLKDFQLMANSDETEVGDRGINFSGGQKQRISIARAFYSEKDIYLLDDPLSAVDTKVGEHIFKNGILQFLAKKTVLLVTHQLQYLKDCDYVIYLKDGRISEEGTHQYLLTQNGEYADMCNRHLGEQEAKRIRRESQPDEEEEEEDLPGEDVALPAAYGEDIGKLVEAEDRASGSLTGGTYKTYGLAAGGFIFSFLVFFSFLIYTAIVAFNSWWLSYWLENSNSTGTGNVSQDPNLNYFVIIYCLSVIITVIFGLFKGVLCMKAAFNASTSLHDKMFRKVLLSPMNFFDSNPTGRILNRFSKDLEEVDTRLPFMIETSIQGIMMTIFPVVLVAMVYPLFLAALFPMVILFIWADRIFNVAVRETKRLDNISRSPLISHLTTTILGLQTIRAYKRESNFIERFEDIIDNNTIPFGVFFITMRWMGFRVDLLSAIATTITGIFIILVPGVHASQAGLALSSSFQITSTFQFIIRMKAEANARFTSVERIQHYVKTLISEPPNIIKGCRPPKNWPSEGRIVFDYVEMKYRDNLPLILKKIQFNIAASEKIGIVGRTGSGKSSLGVSLFRLVEVCGGNIYIDDIDIGKIGLYDLRSRLSVIPQDPVLFTGTLRYNLDPFNQYNDDELWRALEKAHLKDKVSSLPQNLQTPITGSGSNFSIGQRQLICLGRALLRGSKILLLDEATASVDTETDSLIQQTIKQAFNDCTLLTIAHRLNTVLTCDRIMVMDSGKILEFNTPEVLLSDPESVFRAMLTSSNLKHLIGEKASVRTPDVLARRKLSLYPPIVDEDQYEDNIIYSIHL